MSSDHIAARETISEARAALLRAVKIDSGRRALEGDIEDAYNRLDEARAAVERPNDVAYARNAVSEALALLRTDESRLIAEDTDALEDAIRLLAAIHWD
jgi:hypothetical protein